jgi:hypothetical protein
MRVISHDGHVNRSLSSVGGRGVQLLLAHQAGSQQPLHNHTAAQLAGGEEQRLTVNISPASQELRGVAYVAQGRCQFTHVRWKGEAYQRDREYVASYEHRLNWQAPERQQAS